MRDSFPISYTNYWKNANINDSRSIKPQARRAVKVMLRNRCNSFIKIDINYKEKNLIPYDNILSVLNKHVTLIEQSQLWNPTRRRKIL